MFKFSQTQKQLRAGPLHEGKKAGFSGIRGREAEQRHIAHCWEHTLRGQEKQARLKQMTDRDKISQPPTPPGCLTHWCLRSAKMLRLQPWETCQLHQHISFPLKRERGMRGAECAWCGVLHFGCGTCSPVHDEQEVSSQNSFFSSAALLFLSLLHVVA